MIVYRICDRFNFKKLEKVKEYAIDNKFLKFNYLIKVEEITEYIDVEDFIYNNYINNLKQIYSNKLSNKEDKLIKCLK